MKEFFSNLKFPFIVTQHDHWIAGIQLRLWLFTKMIWFLSSWYIRTFIQQEVGVSLKCFVVCLVTFWWPEVSIRYQLKWSPIDLWKFPDSKRKCRIYLFYSHNFRFKILTKVKIFFQIRPKFSFSILFHSWYW